MSAEFTHSDSDLQARRSRFNPWMITIAVTSGTFMEVFDTCITNVALRHIAGSLAASTDEASWVLTSYLIANAIIVVASGWLSCLFGRKRLLLGSILVFTTSSALCGAAPSLECLIIVRIIQGISGGILQPTAQAVLLETFQPAKRGQAMAVYTAGVMLAPLIGPPISGWIAESYSWRWIFYINIPVGLFAALMTEAYITDPPYLRRVRDLDYMGFGLMAFGLGATQVILDKGQQDDWFSSSLIRNLTIVAIVSLAGFIYRELRVGTPIVDLRVLRNRNFAIGTLLITTVGGATYYATITLVPMFLQTILGYTAALSGETLAPRGIGALVGTVVTWRLAGKIDSRFLLICGFGVLGLSIYLLGAINLDVDKSAFFWPHVLNGFAFGLIPAPLTMAAISTLRTEQICNATALFSLAKILGGSLGISTVTTLLARRKQWYQTSLTSHLTPYDLPFRQRLREVQGLLGGQRAYGHIYDGVLKQSSLLAFIHCFRLLALLCLVCVPLALCFTKGRSIAKARRCANGSSR
jgi:MFS transporter, DHA2 family, multidrug resistance protein